MSESPPQAASRAQVDPFLVMDVMAEAELLQREGKDVLHLEVGQPGTSAPRVVREKAARLLEEERLGYTSAAGALELRERVSRHYDRIYGVAVDPRDVIITTGASGAFTLAFLACFEAGDTVVVPRPGYPCYRNILRALDLRSFEVPVGGDVDFRFTLEALRNVDERPRGVIITSPANPTGAVIEPGEMDRICAYCQEQGIIPIFDEIYHGLVYGAAALKTAAGQQGAVVINSFSKYFSMTGWRLGWMVVPPSLRRAVEVLAQSFTICPPTLSQLAAISAFDAREELDGHVARYAKNRSTLMTALKQAGVTRTAPADGAFYIYADMSAWTDDSVAFCRQMLRDILVATTPGVDFDRIDGKRFVRFSYCADEPAVAQAAQRLVPYLNEKRRA